MHLAAGALVGKSWGAGLPGLSVWPCEEKSWIPLGNSMKRKDQPTGERSPASEPGLSLVIASSPAAPLPFERAASGHQQGKPALTGCLLWSALLYPLPVGRVRGAPRHREPHPHLAPSEMSAFVPASVGSGGLFAFVSGLGAQPCGSRAFNNCVRGRAGTS